MKFTKKTKSDKRLANSGENQFFQSMWDNSFDGMRITNAAGTIIRVNNAYCELVDKRREELEGQPLSIVYSTDQDHILTKHSDRFKNHTVPPRLTRCLDLWNEKNVWLELTNSFIVDVNGQELLLSIFRDITETKLAEKHFHEQVIRTDKILHTTLDGYILSDTEGIIIDVNDSYCQMSGYSRDELLKLNIRDLEAKLSPDEIEQRIARMVKQGADVFETRHRRKDGSGIDLDVSIAVMEGSDGPLVTAFMRDITERKLFELTLQETNTKLEESQRIAKLGFATADVRTGLWTSSSILDAIFGIDKNYRRDQKSWYEIVHPDDRKDVNDYYTHQVLDESKSFEKEYRIIKVDNKEIRWVHALGKLELDSKGKPSRLVGAIQDITERKLVEEKLTRSEQDYRGLFDNAHDAIIIFEVENELVVDANQRAFDLYGYSREEFIGMSLGKISTNIHLGKNRVQEVLENGYTKQFEMIQKHKDGSLIHVEISASRVNYQGSTVILSLNHDITNRKKILDSLRKSEEQYRELVEEAGIAILIDNTQGELKFINSQVCELFGYTREDMLEHSHTTLIHPDDVERVKKIHAQRLEGKKVPPRYEFRGIRKDNSVIHLEVSAALLKEKGATVGTRSYMWDITERKKAERWLTESANLRELLLDIITHDLRNPAGNIHSISELARDEMPENELIEEISINSERLLKVLEHTTILTGATFGEKIPKEKLDLKEILTEVVDEFTIRLDEAKMDLRMDIPENTTITANPLITEVFKNYISNAIKYASNGKKILLEAVEADKSVLISVKDFGKTIPEEDRQSIFNRNIQLANGSKRGRGLGLAIVKRIAAAHEGEVWVEPNTPRGNSFCLRIPS